MGTNYYLHQKGKDILHIGKSSYGWAFSLHVIPELKINSLEDWQSLWEKEGMKIEDEYGRVIPVAEMLATITDREGCKVERTLKFLKENHAIVGMRDLLRQVSPCCVRHGDGTWDCIVGEFS